MPTPSTAEITSALLFDDGGQWSTQTITFSIAGAGSAWPDYAHLGPDWTEFWGNEPYKPQYATLTDVQAQTFRAVMQQWAGLIATPIVETNDVTNPGEIRVAITDDSGHGGYAYEPPVPGQSTSGIAGDIWMDTQWVGRTMRAGWNTYAGDSLFPTLLHETGHALGLKHPFEGATTLPVDVDQYRYTVMSYEWREVSLTFTARFENSTPVLFTQGKNIIPTGPMVFDILAIQSLYGANPHTAAGDTVYRPDVTEPYVSAIYDAGGTDTIDASGQLRASSIDLTPGAYSSIGIWTADEQLTYWTNQLPAYAAQITDLIQAEVARGTLYTWHDNLGIAYSTTIENAIGGSGDDTISGNVAANTLTGNGGADRIFGAAGADTVNGGAGADTIDGGADPNYLRGDEGNDSVVGGANFDDINGNMGNDTAHGGQGNDWVVGGKDQDALFGDDGDDIVYGNLGDDTCDGGAGADLVRGGQGDDLIAGGAGDDWLSGDRGVDTIAGGAGADIFHGSADAGWDFVTDFNVAQGDRVQLDPGTAYTVEQLDADVIVRMSGSIMVLLGVQLSSLPSGWIFAG